MKCLIIMPFARQFDAVHAKIKQCVVDAFPDRSVSTLRLDEVRIAGKITSQLIEALQGADLYIADLTGQSPNVMWETGFAAAVGRPAIFISQSTDPLPFDVKDERVVHYKRRKLDATLYQPLMRALQETVKAYRHRPTTRKIVVTGTGTVHPQRAHALLSTLLEPYFGHQIRWYCGANGTTDEVVIDLLIKKGERVFPVFDRIYRITTGAQDLIQTYKLKAVEAEQEMEQSRFMASLPHRAIGLSTTAEMAAQPNSAMIEFFLEYSDLLILLGDPGEGRTKKLFQGADARQRPYLLARP